MKAPGNPGTEPRGEWPLAGSVKPYHRHLVACTGTRSWPARLEEAPGLLGRMAGDAHELRETIPFVPKVTATDDPSEGAGLDLLVFPDAIRLRDVDEAAWAAILEVLRHGGDLRAGRESEPLTGWHVFVCVHEGRDERCGTCGPPLIDALREAIEGAGRPDVTVHATSHVGGHKYAGNVIVYPGGAWYGYVRPSDAPTMLRHVIEGRIIEDLHRGSMLPS